ncbi:substrate-binding domain-containing protein [Streptosporangium sp. NBC_01756]|uniref:substrate-binding domain-containing protein n=1 Tax=Streptosporangium sp. NBC_01756 TaxID=2975950 RepID=UPI002DD9D945|nr:substrate-binding domain-containing protein [Streptosporangium sp. NBC_01756]WSC85700.1 substrate-binding domain-containing protein [Streptosporangium sp. NBC_01756]
MKTRSARFALAAPLLVALMATTVACAGDSGAGDGKFKIALNLSTTNNQYQTQARNLIKAASETPPYKDKVSLGIDVAGVDVTRQIQTINNEVSAGYKAILLYPVSPTALNPAIERACKAGVTVIAWDSPVTAPCAYNVALDLEAWGYTGAKWLVDKMGGKGNLAVIRGIEGVPADVGEYKGVQKAIAGTDVKIVAEPVGNWAAATIKTAFAQAYAAHPEIDAVWGATGCVQVWEVTNGRPIYCSGGASKTEMMLMAPKSDGGQGITTNIAAAAPPYSGELAFQQAVQILEGQKVPKNTLMPIETYTSENVKVGTDPAQGANLFVGSEIPPDFFPFWNPLVEQGLQAALHGTPDKISTAKPCSQVPGCGQR